MAETMVKQRKLVLANGMEFIGTGFGSMNDALSEMVFNTSMVGYQEIVTDPGSTEQIMLMTYPLIGNYGINDEDSENRIPTLTGLVVREYCDEPSNFRYTKTLAELMEESGIPGLQGVDTRVICRVLRDEGSQTALICDANVTLDEALARIRAYEVPADLVKRVSCRKKSYARTPNPRYSVVAVDCGLRQSLIKKLNELGCNVTVVPYDTSADTIMSFKPDGVLISNGPGDPANVKPVIEAISSLRGHLPIFGVDMGCQLIALACGAKVRKLKVGHHGGNQPVREVKSGKMLITSQNHSFVIDASTLEAAGLELTHVNQIDGSVEGVACMADRIFGVQYQPSGDDQFGQFILMMEEEKRNA